MKPILFVVILLCVGIFSCTEEIETSEDQDLYGLWEFDKFVSQDSGDTTTISDAAYSIISFDINGKFDFDGPCNNGNGQYLSTDGFLEITKFAITKLACDNLDVEFVLTDNLSGDYTIEGDYLTIESENGYDLILKKVIVN